MQPLSGLKKLLILAFSISLGYYTLFYLFWFFIVIPDAGFGGLVVLPIILGASLIAVAFYYLIFQKLTKTLSDPKWLGYLMLANVVYVIITLFLNVYPGLFTFSHISLTTDSKYHLADKLSYSVMVGKGSVLFHSLSFTTNLREPDGSITTDSDDTVFSVDERSTTAFPDYCHFILVTIFCYYPEGGYYPPVSGQLQTSPLPLPFNPYKPKPFTELGTYELSASSNSVKGTNFEVVAATTNTVIQVPGYEIARLDSTQNFDDLPADADFGISYHGKYDTVWVSRKDTQKSYNSVADLQQSGLVDSTISVDGNKILTNSSSQLYWVNQNKLFEVYIILIPGYPPSNNSLDNEVFKAYLKKYPSSL